MQQKGAGKEDEELSILAGEEAGRGRLVLDDDGSGRGGLFLDLVLAYAAAAPARLDEVAALDAAQQIFDRARRNDGVLPDRDPRQNGSMRADPDVVLDDAEGRVPAREAGAPQIEVERPSAGLTPARDRTADRQAVRDHEPTVQ